MSNNIRKFRIINKTEKNLIFSSLSKVLPQIHSVLDETNSELLISFNILNGKDKFPKIYFAPKSLTKLIDNFQSGITISSVGVYFGFIKKNRFFLSLEGTEFLYKLKVFDKKKQLIVNDDGEKSILYGNHIIKRFLRKIPKDLKKNNFLLVFNNSNELISIAFSQVNFESISNLKPNDIIAKNLLDKGYYLRKEQ